MKRLLIAILFPVACLAQVVPHAVLTPDLLGVERIENVDAGIVNLYRADPSKSNKVALYRLLVVQPRPVPEEFRVVEPGEWVITATNATRNWVVRDMTVQELSTLRSNRVDQVSDELLVVLSRDQWEPALVRPIGLMAEAVGLMAKALVRANLHTNLTVPDRQRFVKISNEVATIVTLIRDGRAIRNNVMTNSTIQDPTMGWPTNRIGE